MANDLVNYRPSKTDGALGRMLVIGDHASNFVPPHIDLGIDPAILHTHRAVDLGTAELAFELHKRFGCAVANATVSRLVVDLNRHRDEPSTIPPQSDGEDIPGNHLDDAQRGARLSQFYDGYHRQIGEYVDQEQPRLIIFLHSFTPMLATHKTPRPWHCGVMYDRDERAGRIALDYFGKMEIAAGNQLPYSGKIYNSSFLRHAESRGIAYLGLEVRQDLLGNDTQISAATDMIAAMASRILARI